MKILTTAQALDVIRTASEVKVEIAEDTDEPADAMRESLRLLLGIGNSLQIGGERIAGALPD